MAYLLLIGLAVGCVALVLAVLIKRGGRVPACRTCGVTGADLAEGMCTGCWTRMRAHRATE